MLIILAIVVGATLLGKAGKQLATPAGESAGPAPGQLSGTGMAPTDTMPRLFDRALNFTPSKQQSAAGFTFPMQLLTTDHADPSLTALRNTYNSSTPNPGAIGMLSIQRFFSAGPSNRGDF